MGVHILALAARVVSFGCDVSTMLPASTPIEHWDDVPMVSDGYAVARDVIVRRVGALLDGS